MSQSSLELLTNIAGFRKSVRQGLRLATTFVPIPADWKGEASPSSWGEYQYVFSCESDTWYTSLCIKSDGEATLLAANKGAGVYMLDVKFYESGRWKSARVYRSDDSDRGWKTLTSKQDSFFTAMLLTERQMAAEAGTLEAFGPDTLEGD